MYSLKTILAATDLTRRGAAVVPRAVQLARLHQARLIIVHAVEPGKGSVKRFRLGRPAATLERARSDLAALCATYPDLDIHCHVEACKPAPLITRIAQENQADLIVLGLHLPRRVLDTLRLTNLERITQTAACPVLIAHAASDLPYRKVLGAITFAPASARALRVAAHLAPEAEIHAIHALQMRRSATNPVAELKTSPEVTKAETLRQAFLDFEALPDRLTRPEIVPGGVHEVLQFRMNELDPDLVVIGSHSGRSATTLGNYARDLMRAPPTDMLIAKPV